MTLARDMGRIEHKRLDAPDEVLELPRLTVNLVRVGSLTVGLGTVQPVASASAAIRCAASIRDATAGIGLPVRIGVHTGEIELLPGDIGGVAVHAAARVMGLGRASEVMVSASTRGLVEDGELRFESRGEQKLKGFANPLGVFILVD